MFQEKTYRYIMISFRDRGGDFDSASEIGVVRTWAEGFIRDGADTPLGLLVMKECRESLQMELLWHYTRTVEEDGSIQVHTEHKPGAPHIY